jgi:TP901 family phage tail tape measure protein
MKLLSAQLKSQMEEAVSKANILQKAQMQGAKVGIPTAAVGGPFSAYDAVRRQAAEIAAAEKEAAKLAKTNERLGTGFKKLASDGNDVHSMARGLASGFGALWLTWGNLAPLFIGAAISNSFVQTAKTGMEVAHVMETIAHVGGNTKDEMASLNEEMLKLARTGPFAPLEIAEAMKTLSLAGLKANEILMVTKDVLNFSIAGTTDLKTAAETLMSVSTAFGMGAAGFARVGDVISKAAAESMTSVENFSSAMKTASVINAQYGVSLEDTATAIAAMSQLGIQGTSAGTALRNMYADLSGRSAQVAKVLRQQGIEMRDSTGAFRPMIEVVGQLNEKLLSLDGISQKNLMQALLSERGAKGIVEMLRLIQTEAKNMGSGLANALEESRQSIDDSAGFAAITAAKMAQTAKNQFLQVKSALAASMQEVYTDLEPALLVISDSLQKTFGSAEFKEGLRSLVIGVAEFSKVLIENAELILKLAALYAGLKLAQMAIVSTLGLLNAASNLRSAIMAKETASVVANTTAELANAAAKAATATAGGRALAIAGGLARAIPFVGTALTMVTGAWTAYDYWVEKSNTSAVEAAKLSENNIVKSLNDQAEKLNALNALREEGLTLQEAEIRLMNLASGKDRTLRAAQMKAAAESEYASSIASPETKTRVYAAQIAAADRLLEEVKSEGAAVDKAVQNLKSASNWRKSIEDREAAQKAGNAAKFGTGKFELGDSSDRSGMRKSPLFEILNREERQAAALAATSTIAAEFNRIQTELADNLQDLNSKYAEATDKTKELTAEKLKQYTAERDLAEQKIKGNAATQLKQTLDKRELEYAEQQLLATQAQVDALEELENARFMASSERQRQIKLDTESFAFEQSLQNQLPAVQAVEKAKFAIRASYTEKLRLMEAEHNKSISVEGLSTDAIKAANKDFNKAKSAMQTEGVAEEDRAQAQIYQSEWDKVTGTIAGNLTSKLMNGTLDIKEFMIETFASMVLQPQLNILMQQGADALLGGSGGWFSALMGRISGFEGGGFTGTGPRSGGLDGKGGFVAMVHPNETITDHTKAGNTGGSAPVYVTINNTVGDVATKSMLDQANAATVKQIQAGIARSSRYNGAMAR